MSSEAKQFSRQIEDFVCEHCGTNVVGDGYTNHCPSCLWSKHVDVNPGDRAATCGAMMEPISVEGKGGEYIIQHRCQACAHTRPNRTRPEDDFATVIQIAQR